MATIRAKNGLGVFLRGLLALPTAGGLLLAASCAKPAPNGVVAGATPATAGTLGYFYPIAEKPSEAQVERKMKMGPPPPGYEKIVGEPMPNWTPDAFGQRSTPFQWTFMGPRPISNEYWSGRANAGGRVVSIAPHPTDPDTVYIASASGGIWKTVNGGTTWTPMTDHLPILNHGFVALDPTNPNTVYAGTGEYQQSSAGDGLFRSLDAGVTWNRIATTSQVGSQCSGIAISHANPQVIHVTSSAGYHRSTNGGTNWSTLINSNCSALLMHPTNANIVYIARRGTGIYRSTTGGGSLVLLSGGLPTSGFDRIVMDISRSNPQVLYAAFISGSNLQGLYKTINGGDTWTQLTNTPNYCQPQCWYDVFVGVDPANENIVFCGGVDPRYATAGVLRSTNGGDSWVEVSNAGGTQLHPDHHAIAWGPTGIIWEANDGGIYKSTNGGNSWINLNATLAASQMYHVTVHPNSPTRILAGTQDNGTPERTSESFTWPQLQTGDGGYSVFDFTNFTRRYTTYVYLAIYRWNNTNSSNITGPWSGDRVAWIAPLVGDPNSSTTLYGGTQRIWRTTNATSSSVSWSAITPNDLAGAGTFNIIAVAQGNSNIIYTGNTRGLLYVTTDAQNWDQRNSGFANNTNITGIVIHPSNHGTAYAAQSSSSGSRIFRTDTFGQTWTAKGSNLPSGVSPRCLAVDYAFNPPVMYVGSGAGIYVSLDDGQSWIKNDSTFPNVNVSSLHIDPVNRALTVGTYGRGVWRTPLVTPPPCVADFNGDGGVDGADVEAFFLAWEVAQPQADINEDGGVDGGDVEAFFLAWELGC
ncbi:MAG: hypothetical protein KF864_06365 [Phycisphaeraceae bacterium]|nr:hypothetical protein [Phycisphaeraceae bacterium]